MAIRKWMVVASLALVAVMALTVASIGSAKPEANAAIKVDVRFTAEDLKVTGR